MAQIEVEDGNADLRSHVSNIEEGARILTIFYPLSTIDRLLPRYDGLTCGAIAPKEFVKTSWHSLKVTLAHIDAQLKKEQGLLALAEKLFQNTAKPLRPPGSASMLEYARMVNGQDVRWETIGVLLATLGLCIMPATSRDAEILKSHSSPTRQSMCKRLIQATNSCLKFCDGSGSINDPVLWILGCNLILLTQFYGDSSGYAPSCSLSLADLNIQGYVTWKRLGDISSAVFAMGLHQEIVVTSEIPRWLAEMRKQLMNFAYTLDINLSLFVGRPPRISSRYCSLDLPFALDNDQLALPSSKLESAIEHLKEVDWTSKDTIPHAGMARITLPITMQREEILELFLGPARNNTQQIAT